MLTEATACKVKFLPDLSSYFFLQRRRTKFNACDFLTEFLFRLVHGLVNNNIIIVTLRAFLVLPESNPPPKSNCCYKVMLVFGLEEKFKFGKRTKYYL